MRDRVPTTIKIEARGVGVIHEITETLRPGDTYTMTIDVPIVFEVNGKVVSFLYNGRTYRVTA